MVDLSDVRSMSRPCSPLSVFPIPCIMRPVEEQATKHTYTLECCPHSNENTNARVAVVIVKGNHPGRQAPGKARVDNRGTNKQLIQPTLVSLCLTLALHSFSFPLSFFAASILSFNPLKKSKRLENKYIFCVSICACLHNKRIAVFLSN